MFYMCTNYYIYPPFQSQKRCLLKSADSPPTVCEPVFSVRWNLEVLQTCIFGTEEKGGFMIKVQ